MIHHPRDNAGCAETLVSPPDHSCAERDKKWVLVVAILASALGFIEGSVVSIAMPAIREGLDASFVQVQWIMNAYILVLGALILPGGALGDRFGQRTVLMVGMLIFLGASLAAGLAPNAEVMIFWRIIQGIGSALMIPGSLALIAKNFPKEERGAAIGIWSGAAGLTTALGPVLGGFILASGAEAAWRWVFWMILPLGALALMIMLWRVPKDPGQSETKIDWIGGFLAMAGLGLIAYALTNADSGGLLALIAGLAGTVIMALFILVQSKLRAPMMPPALFREKSFSGANGLTFLVYLALGGVLFFAPMTLIEQHGMHEAKVGAMFIPFTLVMAALSRWAGGLADKIGTRWPLTVGPLITAVGLLAVAFAVPTGHFYGAVLPAMTLLGVGMGIAVPPLSTAVMNAVEEGQAGVASGVNNAVARLAQIFAIAGLGLVATAGFQSALRSAGIDPAGIGFGGTVADEAARATAMGAGFTSVAMVAAVLCAVGGLIGFITQPSKQDTLEKNGSP